MLPAGGYSMVSGGARGVSARGGGAAGAGGVACGGAACGCDETTIMSFVGHGGNYRQDVTYCYAGNGQGEFDLVSVPTGVKCNVWFIGIGAGGILALLYLLFIGSAPTTTSTPPIIIPTTSGNDITSAPYDCEAGYANWQDGWSIGKKAWCCDQFNRGCPGPKTTKAPYCCKVHGNPGMVNGWSVAHRDYCCTHYGTACKPTRPPDPNCAVGTAASWEEGKRRWCCLHHHVGCMPNPHPPVPVPAPAPVPIPVTSNPYDCNAGFSNWEAGWSIAKKAWCCQNEQRGCPTSSMPYDCNAGFANWQSGWSTAKKAWCCANGGHGCPTTECPYDCNAGFSNWANGWSLPKKAFCCRTQGKGC